MNSDISRHILPNDLSNDLPLNVITPILLETSEVTHTHFLLKPQQFDRTKGHTFHLSF